MRFDASKTEALERFLRLLMRHFLNYSKCDKYYRNIQVAIKTLSHIKMESTMYVKQAEDHKKRKVNFSILQTILVKIC